MKWTRKYRKAIYNKDTPVDKKQFYRECKKKHAYSTTADANRMIRHQYKKYGIKHICL